MRPLRSPLAVPFVAFMAENRRWLAAGFLMALASSVGQTFFIGLFSAPIRATYGLSHADFGAIYMAGTLLSAAFLLQLGRLADSAPPRRLAVAVTLCLAGVAALMAVTPHVITAQSTFGVICLIGLIFGLRLLGQGMISHLSQTVTARWFSATRGRALSIVALGYPAGEALAPLAVVGLAVAVGWTGAWAAAAALLALVVAPMFWALLAADRTPRGALAREVGAPGLGGRHWTRGEAVRAPLFWLVLPGMLAPGFIVTVVFFLPDHIAAAKGWSVEALAAQYWIYALTSVAGGLVAGVLIDRFTARVCLSGYQLPMVGGLALLQFGQSEASFGASMALFGVTSGAAATLHAAFWSEIYGTRHIGAIKAMGHAAMVLSTAAGPGLVGALIDAGAPLPEQAPYMALYALAASAFYTWLAAFGALRRAQ